MVDLISKGYGVARSSERYVTVAMNGADKKRRPLVAIPPRWYQRIFYSGFENCVSVGMGSPRKRPYDRQSKGNTFAGVYEWRSVVPSPFSEIGKMPCVHSIYLENVSFSIDELQHLRHCKQLRTFRVGESRLDDQGNAASFPNIDTLEEIAIACRNTIIPAGFAESILEACPSLRSLLLAGRQQDVSLGKCAIASDSSLKAIRLHGFHVSNDFVQSMPRSIEWLVLRHCTLEDQRRVAHIVSQFPRLRSLDVSSSNVDDAFVQSLQPRNLESLKLVDTAITTSCLSALERLPLRHLDVSDTAVAAEQIVRWHGEEVMIRNGKLVHKEQ